MSARAIRSGLRRARTALAAGACCLAWTVSARAQVVDYGSLEELFGEPVTTSATGSPRRASQVPANMEIITAEDIRRSGADNLPDILRLVPGIDVRRYGFAAAEGQARREAAMPPFGRLAAVIVSGEDAAETKAAARALGLAAPHVDGLAVYGPAPAPLATLRGRHRHRLLAHASRSFDLQGVLRDWLGGVETPRGVRVTVDVDPYSFL